VWGWIDRFRAGRGLARAFGSGFLERFEVPEVVAELAIDHTLVTDELIEVVVAGEGQGLGVGGFGHEWAQAGGVLVGRVVSVIAAGHDARGLMAVGSPESPPGDGDALDDEALDGMAWEVLLIQLGEQSGEFVEALIGLIGGHEDGLSEQAVLTGVLAGAGLALGSPGPGGFGGVTAIGVDSALRRGFELGRIY